MRLRAKTLLGATALLLVLLLTSAFPSAGLAAPASAWKLSATSQPTHFVSGTSGKARYLLIATNVGAKATAGEITITDTLSSGLTAVGPLAFAKEPAVGEFNCEMAGSTVSCKGPGPVPPGAIVWAEVPVNVSAPSGSLLTNEAEISGGGAPPVKASTQTPITDSTPAFDFLPGEEGFRAPLIADDGAPVSQAGSHPYEAIIDANFPTVSPGGSYTGAGHPRDISIDLPPGLLANPSATPMLCTEAELVSENQPGCPAASQIGTVTITTFVLALQPEPTALYNMVPPPGAPAAFGFNALGVGVFPHVIASIRSESDYGATGTANDILARGLNPILSVSTELWGDPSSKAHGYAREPRGGCTGVSPCEIPPRPDAFLTLPTACPGIPDTTTALADSWEEPGVFRQANYESSDLAGNPVSVSGCNQLRFEPAIDLKPTTDLTDSPAGLDVDLHQLQDTDKEHTSTAALKEASVTLPEGLVVNPAQGAGLEACSAAQIGTLTPVGLTPAHFSAKPSSCPDASKIGTVEVTSPLLAEYDPEHKLQSDPETGKPIPAPLHGAVYLAKPFENPFGSLLAIYLTVEDPKTGIFAKLAGEIEADPQSGQLTTFFEENPQLPLEDVRLHLFPGARASLITPLTCATHTTTSDLTPFSTPEGADARPESSFQTTATPTGATCPTSPEQASNAPRFSAGTLSPQAGAYSPFLLRISREDGTQRLTKIDTTLPPGLAARFAGVGECSEAQIAAAGARSHPEEGILEQQNPSCPASSRLGRVLVGAGAGPTPLYTEGTAYLAGPYKSAPFSLIIITPAIAGPFDLGTVVVRTALYVNPDTAQGRAVSDPLPTILDGIPLDVRSVAIKMDRPNFTLNPTNCNPFAVTGTATSAFGAVAPLTSPFQVGGCPELPFKPRLSLQLKGKTKRTSHPALVANLTAKPGEANVAKAQVKLPKAAFLDNSNINTICTRVQFAADTCPSGSIYGKASATTPLLDAPLSGAVYLRSSSHALPDLVVKLKGPTTQPIEIDLAGRTDSVKGALRNTFEAVPDAPVTSFHLELFGGKRGLIELSSGFCKSPKAQVQMDGQNGKVFDTNPVVGTSCPKKDKKKSKHRNRAHG